MDENILNEYEKQRKANALTTQTANNPYEDIDKLINNQNELINKSHQTQQDMINNQVQMNVNEIERNKQKAEEEALKQNKASFIDYQKQINQYGTNSENLASAGLGGSGYAESSKTSMYNQYQKNVTETQNNLRNITADYNMKIAEARKTGDIQKQQAAMEMYQMQLEQLKNQYEMKQQKDQFLYQQQRDQISDNRYNQEWEYQKKRDEILDNRYLTEWERQKQLDALEEAWRQKEFNYQQERDKISDSQWQKEYELSKKNSVRSSSSSSRRSSAPYPLQDTSEKTKEYSPQEIMKNMKVLQGPGISQPIQDGYTGKTFSSLEGLLNYYGYGTMQE